MLMFYGILLPLVSQSVSNLYSTPAAVAASVWPILVITPLNPHDRAMAVSGYWSCIYVLVGFVFQ